MANYVPFTGRMTRRTVLRGGFAAGMGLAGAALIGCVGGITHKIGRVYNV